MKCSATASKVLYRLVCWFVSWVAQGARPPESGERSAFGVADNVDPRGVTRFPNNLA